MEVIEQNAEGLERRFTVKVPASELGAKLDARLEDLKGRAHLKGFRKGKAPVSHLRKLYGKGIMGEIVQEIVSETSSKAFSERSLRPATTPHPHLKGDIEAVFSGKADLEYEVHAEILPEFEPADVAGLAITRPVAEVPEADIDEALKNLADQNKTYEARGKTAKAKDGDLVVIDFLGKIDGVAFPGGEGEKHELVLGSGAFIPGFEEQLVGAKADTDLTVTVTFPAEYRASDLAGKEATFDVHVHEVKAPKDAAVDDDFAKGLGLADLADLKARVKERLEADYRQLSRAHAKRALLDRLDEAHSFDLPKSMVEAEFQQIWRQVLASERDEEDKDKSDDELKSDYRKIAERRVRLGLVLAEIGRRAEVQVPKEDLQRAVQSQAIREAQMLQMQGQNVSPQQVLQYFQQTPEAIAQIRAPLFEERVVDYVLERAKVTDKTVSKDELLKEPDGEIA